MQFIFNKIQIVFKSNIDVTNIFLNIPYPMTSYPNTKAKYRERTYLGSGTREKDLENPKMKFI